MTNSSTYHETIRTHLSRAMFDELTPREWRTVLKSLLREELEEVPPVIETLQVFGIHRFSLFVRH